MNLLRSICSITVIMIALLLPVAARAQQPLPAEGNESKLLVILNSDAELFAKAKACQRLAIIGTSKSVPVVAQLLADPVLSHYARIALEANPSLEVDQAFRDALHSTPICPSSEKDQLKEKSLRLCANLC